MRTVATGREECVRMPMKAARLGPRPVFRLPQMPVAARASRLACGKPGKNGNIQASFRVIRGIPVEGYKSTFAKSQDAFPEPTWLTQPLEELIGRSFDNRMITSADHPALLRLTGAKL